MVSFRYFQFSPLHEKIFRQELGLQHRRLHVFSKFFMQENDVTSSNVIKIKKWRHQTNQNDVMLVRAVICHAIYHLIVLLVIMATDVRIVCKILTQQERVIAMISDLFIQQLFDQSVANNDLTISIVTATPVDVFNPLLPEVTRTNLPHLLYYIY